MNVETNPGTSSKASRKVIALVRKNLVLYAKKGPVIVFGLMFPFFIMLSWMIGREIPTARLFTGVVSMAGFFTSTAISPVIFPIETREKSFERQMAAPLALTHVIWGIVLASSTYSFIITTITSTVLLLALGVGFASVGLGFAFFGGLLVMSVLGSFLGVLLAALPTDMTSNVMMVSNLVKFPLLFMSGIFVAVAAMSPAARVLSWFSPLTFYVDIVAASVDASPYFPLYVDFLGMLVWAAGLYVAAYLAHRRSLPRRFAQTGRMMRGKM
ncbi:MAG: ABC transporter permease [Promethearchaeota archaeon]